MIITSLAGTCRLHSWMSFWILQDSDVGMPFWRWLWHVMTEGWFEGGISNVKPMIKPLFLEWISYMHVGYAWSISHMIFAASRLRVVQMSTLKQHFEGEGKKKGGGGGEGWKGQGDPWVFWIMCFSKLIKLITVFFVQRSTLILMYVNNKNRCYKKDIRNKRHRTKQDAPAFKHLLCIVHIRGILISFQFMELSECNEHSIPPKTYIGEQH